MLPALTFRSVALEHRLRTTHWKPGRDVALFGQSLVVQAHPEVRDAHPNGFIAAENIRMIEIMAVHLGNVG